MLNLSNLLSLLSIQTLVGEDSNQRNVSRKMSLVIGARRHLEWGHEKYLLETIQSHPAQVSVIFMYLLFPSAVSASEEDVRFTSLS